MRLASIHFGQAASFATIKLHRSKTDPVGCGVMLSVVSVCSKAPQQPAQCTPLWQHYSSEWPQRKPPVHWTLWDPSGSATGDISNQMVGRPVRFAGGGICQPFIVQRGRDISFDGRGIYSSNTVTRQMEVRLILLVRGGARPLPGSADPQDGPYS